MRRSSRGIALLMVMLLLVGLLPAGQAEVVSLGIVFIGVRENGETISLEGSFRIYQNGQEMGTIRAGVDTLTLNSIDPIHIEPMPETIAPGWDLTDAAADVTPDRSGVLTVPIQAKAYSDGTTPAPAVTPTPVPTAEPTVVPVTEAPANAKEQEPEETQEAPPSAAIIAEPIRSIPTPHVFPEPTEEPAVPDYTPVETGGSLRVSIFDDKNFNGEKGPYESMVSGVNVYLLTAEEETIVTGGVTNTEGELLLEGIAPGDYRISIWAPDEWGFTEKGKTTEITSSCIGKTSEGNATSDVFTIRAGEETAKGVGMTKLLHVSGYIWLEDEADGICKSGEAKLAGVHVTLEGERNGLSYETWTDENGYYCFDRVRPAFHILRVQAPEGMMFTRYSKNGGKARSIFTTEGVTKAAKTLDLNDKASKEDQNIGFMWAARVTGRVFLDANYNGMYDEGELPLAGVKITAIKQIADEEIAVTYSQEDGTFVLDGLRGNTFTIRAVLPDDGADFTRVVSDPAGNQFKARVGRRENFWKDFVLEDGQTRVVNVGAIYPGTVSGTVYLDDDFSATISGSEKIISGFQVTLLDAEGNVAATDRTNIKGVYSLTGLVPGTYSLRVNALNGYAFTRRGEGNVILNRTGGEGYSEPFEVALGAAVTGQDIGMIRPGTVKGTVFADENDNGRMDAGEAGLQGVIVRLMSQEGEEAFSAEIDGTGSFLFDAVMPGRYQLTYELPENAVFAQVAAGGNQISGEDGLGASAWFDFATGATVEAELCGALTLGTIEGMVFDDPNGNGFQEEGESLLAGATLVLTPTRSDLTEQTIVTDEIGAFRFDGLHPDEYSLRISLPDGRAVSRTDGLKLALKPGQKEQTIPLTVRMGDTWMNQAIGAAIPAGLSGMLWLDENDDGLWEEGEQTPAGYRLKVIDEVTGNVYRELTTDADGRFAAEDLIPGAYTLTFALAEDILGAKSGDSNFATRDGSLVLEHLTLAEGETAEALKLGIVRYTHLGGQVWIDRGEGLEPLGGAVMTLKNEQGETLQTMTTAESGTYRFTRLMPGRYTIEGDMPAQCVVVEPEDERLQTGWRSIAAETSGRHGVSAPIQLIMGEDQDDLDMGCVLPGRLGDYCWLDLNGDGLQDYNEDGIPGVKIELMRGGVAVMETVSDPYGFYRFEEVYPATYTLRVTPPAEVKPTRHREDIRLIASVLEETEDLVCTSVDVVVQSDHGNYNADLGFVLRQAGVIPAGVGEGATQDWTPIKGSDN